MVKLFVLALASFTGAYSFAGVAEGDVLWCTVEFDNTSGRYDFGVESKIQKVDVFGKALLAGEATSLNEDAEDGSHFGMDGYQFLAKFEEGETNRGSKSPDTIALVVKQAVDGKDSKTVVRATSPAPRANSEERAYLYYPYQSSSEGQEVGIKFRCGISK